MVKVPRIYLLVSEISRVAPTLKPFHDYGSRTVVLTSDIGCCSHLTLLYTSSLNDTLKTRVARAGCQSNEGKRCGPRGLFAVALDASLPGRSV